jgi:uncharacterized membrane protein
MDAVHLHLALNHAPLFALLFGALGLAYAAARRSDDAARLSLYLLVLAGLLAAPVYFTGEETEEAVEHLAGVSEAVIEPHEEAGQVAAIGAGLLGLVALGGLIAFRRRSAPRPLVLGVLGLALVAAAWVGYTANLGGQIRHTEIRDGTPPSATEAPLPRSSYDDD